MINRPIKTKNVKFILIRAIYLTFHSRSSSFTQCICDKQFVKCHKLNSRKLKVFYTLIICVNAARHYKQNFSLFKRIQIFFFLNDDVTKTARYLLQFFFGVINISAGGKVYILIINLYDLQGKRNIVVVMFKEN